MESKEEIVQGKMVKPLVYITIITGILAMIIAAVIKLTLFVNNNEFAWKFPLEVLTHRVLTITPREKVIVHEYVIPTYPEDIDTDLEKYICDKFGVMDCKIALAVAKAESGMREDAINVNDNGTIDVGVFQINFQSHKDKPECALKKLTDAKSNVDCAYTIWKAQKGFGAWVAYNNSGFLTFYGR